MGSSGPPSDRSLSSGISFPQWMKGKMDNRRLGLFDFEQGALSPPSYDDTFFHIKYPRSVNSSSNVTQPDGFRSINTVINKQEINNNGTSSESTTQITKIKSVEHIDFSKHPLPCRPFIPLTDIKGSEKISSNLKTKSITKSQGTDDGFHGEPARCGKSIVHVANRIMSGALGKKIDQIHVDEQMEKKSVEPKIGGSKSLPVSPITTPISTPDSSPKVQRRAQGNRFFTGAFIPDRDKYQGGWILSSLFNQSREVTENKIEEEDESIEIVKPKILNRKKSISSQNLSYLGNEKFNEEKINAASNSVGFQAEPSELREMNFWSPTSM
ncbi:hypothetical protein PV326_011170 [Microctonus aethiopoides]|nr:hypothetical protein PV326_011170 [Microctonus aethiopoides]